MTAQTKINPLYTALFAVFSWGLLPVYWKNLQIIPAFSILCHRMIWSCLFVGVVLTFQKRWPEVKEALYSPKKMAVLLASSLFIGLNWLLYIWAVNNGYILETSLGYYINPLFNILLGCIIFRDRLRTAQILSILCAAVGVGYMVFAYGHLPWIALVLALSFSMYGLIRKIINVAPLPGLFVETLFLTFPALAYLLFFDQGQQFLPSEAAISFLLLFSGVATTLPLWAFTFAAKNLSLVTVGIIQFISPSLAFLLGVFAYKETFTPAHLVTFLCIWTGLCIYSIESWIHFKNHIKHIRK